MKQFVVAPGCSVNVNTRNLKLKRTHFEQGEILPDGIPAENLEKLVKKGFVKVRGGEVEKDPEPVQHLTEDGKVTTVKPTVAATRFTMDPKKLAGKSVDELNVMLREIDKEAPVFKTAPEAIAALSKDFLDPTPVGVKSGPPPKPAK